MQEGRAEEEIQRVVMTPKVRTAGTHRAVTLEATHSKLQPLLGALGITRIANITGLDCIGIPVVVVCRPNSRALAVAQGKGCTLLAAQVSGLMESIEFYHAENVSRPLLLGSWSQLRFTHTLLDPEQLPKSAVGRYHADLKIHWVEGIDLIQERSCWVPYELVHSDFTLPLPVDSGCFPMTSNGLASGNRLCEAVVHGAAEVIERDADTLFRLEDAERRAKRRIRLESIDSESCFALIDRFDRANVAVAVWNMTTDVGVPCFRVVIMDRELNPLRPLVPNVGMGCHPSRDIALSRALTEAAQSRLTVISGSRDDLPRERFEHANDLKRLEQLRDSAMPGEATGSFRDVPTYESESFEEDLIWLRARLVDVGVEHMVSIDLTKPEFDIPVARVLIPGLEAMKDVPGWTPGIRAKRCLKRSAS